MGFDHWNLKGMAWGFEVKREGGCCSVKSFCRVIYCSSYTIKQSAGRRPQIVRAHRKGSNDSFLLLIMISLVELQHRLRAIDKDPSSLLQEQEGAEGFMREWFFSSPSEIDRKELSYVWTLLYGWELEKLSSESSIITSPPQANTQALLSKPQIHRISQPNTRFLEQEGNSLQYISKREMVIKFQNNLIWVNPSQPFSDLQNTECSLIFILTSANICQILDLMQMPTKNAKLITTETIYRKMKTLSAFLADYHTFVLPVTYLLKADEYFQYGHIMWLMRENCWLEPSYDLHISFPHTRQSFLLESAKLEEAKLVYYGWKKGVITEANYQKYIREWDRTITRATIQLFSIATLPAVKKEKIDWYLTFLSKQLINTLNDHEQDHLFACCEIISLIPNQIIAKKGYRFDYLYLLLEGRFELRDPLQSADSHKFYGLEELRKKEEGYGFTLATQTHATILRIDKGNVLFHLYDLLH